MFERRDDARIVACSVGGQHRFNGGGDLTKVPVENPRFMRGRVWKRPNERQRSLGVADCPKDEEIRAITWSRIGARKEVVRNARVKDYPGVLVSGSRDP